MSGGCDFLLFEPDREIVSHNGHTHKYQVLSNQVKIMSTHVQSGYKTHLMQGVKGGVKKLIGTMRKVSPGHDRCQYPPALS